MKIERSQTESRLCKWQKHKRKIAPFDSEISIFEPHMRHTKKVVCENGDYTNSQIVRLWTSLRTQTITFEPNPCPPGACVCVFAIYTNEEIDRNEALIILKTVKFARSGML